MKKTVLRKYAQLIAQVGVNVQPGQEVFITADLDQPEFVAMVVEECYRRKAKKVVLEWDYQPLQKLHYRYRSLKTLSKVENYEIARWQHYVDELPCRIYLISEDPDGLRGINQTKMAKAQQNRYPIAKPFREAMENKYQWCIAAVPGKAWAKKLFPNLRASQAVEKLWQYILNAARVTDDPIAAWDEHNREVHEKCDYLNSLGIRKLHYTSANGTDFTVGLMERSRFSGASEKSLQGYTFNPNIPSEECFVSPKKGDAEGKAMEWDAEVNRDLLTKLITMDEGSAYLGECALVPYDSPIRNAELLFYNTLFDENAACHLALGNGYADTIQGFEELTLDECYAMGLNQSMIHEDFMIGSADMNIDAICRDGKTIPIFRNGNWAF